MKAKITTPAGTIEVEGTASEVCEVYNRLAPPAMPFVSIPFVQVDHPNGWYGVNPPGDGMSWIEVTCTEPVTSDTYRFDPLTPWTHTDGGH
jgi:hypothetical protein